MTRRLDPQDRIRELSDASVPFNFDVHALFFSPAARGIEAQMHQRLAPKRVNQVNLRREFFYATPAEARDILSNLTGELLQFQEQPEAVEGGLTRWFLTPEEHSAPYIAAAVRLGGLASNVALPGTGRVSGVAVRFPRGCRS